MKNKITTLVLCALLLAFSFTAEAQQPKSTVGSSLHRKRILELVGQARMPAIYATETWTNAGGLMYYGANIPDFTGAQQLMWTKS